MTKLGNGKHRLEVVLTERLYKQFLAQLEKDGFSTYSGLIRHKIIEYANERNRSP